MKKLILILTALITGFTAFSADSKASKPKKNQVVVITKFVIKTDCDRDFLFETRNVANTASYKNEIKDWKEQPDSWSIAPEKYVSSKSVASGEFSYVICGLSKTNEIEIKTADIELWSSYNAKVLIPLFAGFKVPSDAQAVYLGTFQVSLKGEDMVIESIKRVDEYDAAVEYLNHLYDEHYDMARIEEIFDTREKANDAKNAK